GDDTRQRNWNEYLEQHLNMPCAVDQCRLVEFLRDRLEISDHDPGAEGNRQRWIDQHHAPIGVEKTEAPDDLEQRNEEQRVRDEIGQENAGGENSRSPES